MPLVPGKAMSGKLTPTRWLHDPSSSGIFLICNFVPHLQFAIALVVITSLTMNFFNWITRLLLATQIFINIA